MKRSPSGEKSLPLSVCSELSPALAQWRWQGTRSVTLRVGVLADGERQTPGAEDIISRVEKEKKVVSAANRLIH